MIIDLILIAIVGLFGFLGAKRGFTNSILSFVNKIVSLVVALLLAKPFASILLQTPLATLAENIVSPLTEIAILSDTSITTSIQSWILIAFSFVIIYIVAFLAFKLLQALADSITSLPVLKQLDSLLGFCLGIASCMIAVFILLAILSIFQDTTLFAGLFDKIDNSYLTNFLYNNNLIMNILFSEELTVAVEETLDSYLLA
ncbi:MAG: CvpA family protein [Bacillota bacterium]